MLKESLFFFLHPQGGHWVSCRVGFLAGLFVMLLSIATVAGKTTSMDLAWTKLLQLKSDPAKYFVSDVNCFLFLKETGDIFP